MSSMSRDHFRRRLLPPVKFLESASVFTPNMAIRAGGVFAGALMCQGKWAGTGTPDVLTFPRGALVAGTKFYANLDGNGGTVSFWVTPEWAGNDALTHTILCSGSGAADRLCISKVAANTLQLSIGVTDTAGPSTAAWTPDTRYHITVSWSGNRAIDGTNYVRFSVNDVHTYAQTTAPTTQVPTANIFFGVKYDSTLAVDARVEGLVVSRRVWWDGGYGFDLGQGDEINLVWAAGVGADYSLINGSWDTPYSAPTNATPGVLATTGQAWSHPHGTVLLTDTFAQTAYATSAWGDELTPVTPMSVAFNGTTTSIDCGNDASVQNLHDAALTAEAWVRASGLGGLGTGLCRVFDKTGSGAAGWLLGLTNTGGLQGIVYCATTPASVTAPFSVIDNQLHYVKMTFDDAGDRMVRLYIDGILAGTSAAGTGLVVADTAVNLFIGNRSDAARAWTGAIYWGRVSNVVRAVGCPPSRLNPPAPDGNTMAQWNFRDGAGVALDSAVGPTTDGVIANGTWNIVRDLATDAPGERVFTWGYVFGDDAADEGITQTKAGLTAGANYVVRAVCSVEPDCRGIPRVVIYDNTNGAIITSLRGPSYHGTHDGANNSPVLIDSTARWPQSMVGVKAYNITDGSSTVITAIDGTMTQCTGVLAGGTDNDWDAGDEYRLVWLTGSRVDMASRPWTEVFTFELPTIARNGVVADCVSIAVKVVNANTEGMVVVHQVEVQPNLIDNPSLETGAVADPWIPDGWLNYNVLDAGDSEQELTVVHSGTSSFQFNTTAVAEGIVQDLVLTSSNFYAFGCWYFTAGGDAALQTWAGRLIKQYLASAASFQLTGSGRWLPKTCVLRDIGGNDAIPLSGNAGATGARYIDDVYVVAMNAVTLTVTPASQLNSAETQGVRVDGFDSLIQPAPRLLARAGRGRIRFKCTPRHAINNAQNFGQTLGEMLFAATIDGGNFVRVLRQTNNVQLQLVQRGGAFQLGIWIATGLWNANVPVDMEVRWGRRGATLRVNGIERAAIAGVVKFASDFTGNQINWNEAGREPDGVLDEP